MELIYGHATDKGIRTENQDSVMISVNSNVKSYGIADGMGGLEQGSLAAKLTCEAFNDELSTNDSFSADELTLLIIAKYKQISNFLYNLANQKQVKMGTTFSLLNILETDYIVSNAGDTRIYILRANKLQQLTVDHTGERLDCYQTADEDRKSYLRNALTMALGVGKEISPFVTAGNVIKDDVFILCSDGIYKHVDELNLVKAFCGNEDISNDDMNRRCEVLLHEALRNKSSDNMTVIAIRIM